MENVNSEKNENLIGDSNIDSRSLPISTPTFLLKNKTYAPSNSWTSEKIYFDGDHFFNDLCADINFAKNSVFFEVYIFANDPFGKKMAACLVNAANRGVDVRIIVDGFGSPLWKYSFMPELQLAGVKCKIYHRIPFNLVNHFPMLFTNFHLLFSRLEKRNHRKLFIIDKKIAYVGSMNIAAYHLKEYAGVDAWRDTGARVTGSSISALVRAFYCTWSSSLFRHAGMKKIPKNVRVYNSMDNRRLMYCDFLQKIGQAQDRIWLTTAYFVPTGSLLKKLKSAVKRNVDIRILTTAKTDVFPIRWMRSAFYIGLLRSGARIFEYEPSVLHAKSALIDDFAMLGSTNLNNRSFFHDQEVDIVLDHSIDLLEAQFLRDLGRSKEIKIADLSHLSAFQKIAAALALLFRNFF